MKIAEREVRYVAELANLDLSEAEVHKFQADLDEILGHVERFSYGSESPLLFHAGRFIEHSAAA